MEYEINPTITEPESQPTFGDHFIREVRIQYELTGRERFHIRSADDIAAFVRSRMVDNSREQFFALYLDAKHTVASYSLISIGSANATTVHPREVFQRAILTGAVSIAVAHNHPSGSCEPSEADRVMTDRLRQVGEMLSISLLDHVIVSDDSFLSLRALDCWC